MNALFSFFDQLGVDRLWLEIPTFGLIALTSYWVLRRTLPKTFHTLAKKSRSHWDDVLASKGVFTQIANLGPLAILYLTAPWVFSDWPNLAHQAQDVLAAGFVMAFAILVSKVLQSLATILEAYPGFKDKPLKSIAQALAIVWYAMSAIMAVGILLQESPWKLLSGLGALTAILLLIFRDPILGLVASIQMSSLDIVRKGDWIEMPSMGIDGDVLDISLTTVKIQNFDKTITSIPTHKLVTDAFKNWRGMAESGGRRIKRSIAIDIQSIGFLSQEACKELERIAVLKPYLQSKKNELESQEKPLNDAGEHPLNKRHLTNIGTFRAYIEAYLRNLPHISTSLTFLVRQLPSSDRGLPIEVYVFSTEQNWVKYEGIMADIFDHLFAALEHFELSAFQAPSGRDVASLKNLNLKNYPA